MHFKWGTDFDMCDCYLSDIEWDWKASLFSEDIHLQDMQIPFQLFKQHQVEPPEIFSFKNILTDNLFTSYQP